MPLADIHFMSQTSLLFHAFVFLALASFFQTISTDPGSIPDTPKWRTFGKPPPESQQRKRSSSASGARWCRKTGAYKPDRAHYCRVLGRGVLRMDHHCPWMGNTIGFHNHKHFFLFLLYTNAVCAQLGLSMLHLLLSVTLNLPSFATLAVIGAESLALLLSSILVPFFLFHCWLLARNMTTVEFCEKMREGNLVLGEPGRRFPYDVGLFQNLSSVLGPNPLLWAIPLGGPQGEGTSFPSAHTSPWIVSEDLEAVDPVADVGTADANAACASDRHETCNEDAESLDADVGKLEAPEGQEGDGGFLLWRTSQEFTEDLTIGCEFLHDTCQDTIWNMASLCVPWFRRPKAVGRAKTPRAVRIVAVRNGGASSNDDSFDSAWSHSDGRCLGSAFLSD